MDCDDATSPRSSRGTDVVDHTTQTMEWTQLPPVNTPSRGLHRRVRDGLGDRACIKFLERHLESVRTSATHQLEGTDGHLEDNQPTSPSRNNHSNHVREQVRRYSVSSPDAVVPANLGAMSLHRHSAAAGVRTVTVQSSRQSISSTDESAGMANRTILLPPPGCQVGSAPRRSVRLARQSTDPTLRILATGTPGSSDQCDVDTLDQPRSPLHLSSMEPTANGSAEAPARTGLCDPDNSLVAVGNLVPSATSDRSTTPVDDASTARSTSARSPRKRPGEEPSLVSYCLEGKIRRLEDVGASSECTETVLRSNPRKYLRYAQIQSRYLRWCQEQQRDPLDAHATNVINFLAEGRSLHNWAPTTLASYRSAIMDMFADGDSVQDRSSHKLFFKAINDSEIRSLQTTRVNLSPVLSYVIQLGPTLTSLLRTSPRNCAGSWAFVASYVLRISNG